MSAHLGIVKRKCLAEAIHDNFNSFWKSVFGYTAMAACIATALAEILGAGLGLNLLFRIPLKIAVVGSAMAILTLLWYQKYGSLEKLIVGFVSIIGFCYFLELYMVKPDWNQVAIHSIVPKLNSESIIIAMGVLGAVVMPHNMYLHSEVIQNRDWTASDEKETKKLLRFEFLDTLTAMLIGMAINAAMVIVAAAVFHKNGIKVNDLTQASATLRPLVNQWAEIIFGVALLCAGLSSSVTAAIAGGTTFCGYLGKETDLAKNWFKFGALLTIIPATIIIMYIGDVFKALIVSQVCLSIQLPFTMLPLYLLTSSKQVMGKYRNGWFENSTMIITGIIIILLNFLLIYKFFGGIF